MSGFVEKLGVLFKEECAEALKFTPEVVRLRCLESAPWASIIRTAMGMSEPEKPVVKTLRDEFAMAALAGLLAAPDTDQHMQAAGLGLEDWSVVAYRHADAMLKARSK